MADPTKYTPEYSFSGFQTNNPDSPLPAPQVDNEFANVAASVEALVDAVKDVRRSDGALKNGIVTLDSLAPDVSAQIGDGMLAAQEAAEAAADRAEVAADATDANVVTTTASAAVAVAAADAAAAAAVGLKFVTAAVAATTANITLSGPQTIDGVSVIAGQRVLVKNQSTAADNGVYQCNAGAWTRTTDADSWAELLSLVITASGGTVNGGVTYISTTTSGGTIGVTAVGFTTFNSSIIDGAVTTAKIADSAVTTAKLAANAVTTAKITDANVTAAKLATSAVTTAKIADGGVTFAKLGTDVITGATSTAIAAADSVLFSDNSDSGNTKKTTVQGILDLAANSMVLLSTQTVSGPVASVDFTSGIGSTYGKYVVEFVGVVCASSNPSLEVSLRRSGSFLAGANYAYEGLVCTAGGLTRFGATGQTVFQTSTVNLSSNAANIYNGRLELIRPGDASVYPAVKIDCFGDVSNLGLLSMTGAYRVAGTIDGLRFALSGGVNITAGIFKLYGVA